ncbi:ABC transporter substrate-binding protein [Marinovum sp. 2_MG-2023]|uniref:ABC transporter substrate-binding protein n=1 Tax=unclassified Marinovum TaxID=2647166 RepID=UPI0026E1D6E4|nr:MULTISPECIES: ABC transporter substrate-binding protein [unclassified Marinovum]MDO6732629.1 ABC transporter substrate-binding protein [Marinovum sp. 2_MG-2023]MDO6781928.1 ABC transporter substrate-binding protein [Marinovum sp. 1_MG-2023]
MTLPKIPTIALEKVDFLPPNRVTDDCSILTLKSLVLEPMLRWQDGAICPGLFAKWALDTTGCRWTLRLAPGKCYHDGTPVLAEHAAGFITRILSSRDMFGMPWSYARYLAGAAISAEGAVLTIQTPKPFPDLPEVLSEFYLPKTDAQGRPVIGTGPWQVRDFTPGVAVTLWRAKDDRHLRFVAIPKAEDRHAALVAKDIQAATHMERLETPIHGIAGFEWQTQTSTLSVMAYLNGNAGAFADPEARHAANLAIDRTRMVQDVMGGLARPSDTIVSPWHFGHKQAGLLPLRHDPDTARRLLDRAQGPRQITLRSPTYMPERAPEMARFMADAWNDVGFETRIEIAEDRPQYARDIGEKQMGDAAIFDSSPHSTFRVLDDKISAISRAVWWQGVTNDAVDKGFEQARHILDLPTRARAYGTILRQLQDAPPWVYLFHPVLCLAHVPALTGLHLDHKGIMRIT